MTRPAVLFVCLGNICRSPTAEIVFRALLREQGLEDRIAVDSAGTGDWHVGKPPHGPAQHAAREAGYDMSGLRARQVRARDFDEFSHILAMDRQNLADLRRICPPDFYGYLGCLRDFSPGAATVDIDDPYGLGADAFRRAFEEIEAATRAFFAHLQRQP